MNRTEESRCVWPDGTWCYECDLEEYLTFNSDDYTIVSDKDFNYGVHQNLPASPNEV